MNLQPDHLADLQRSGLTDATISGAGLYSVTDPTQAAKILRWKKCPATCGNALAFPFRMPSGELNGFTRLKFDRPRTEKGKPRKYESPKGEPNHAYFPPETIGVIDDPQTPLHVTEGEKKSLAANQAGFRTVGLVGVYGWKRKGREQLIEDLNAVRWEGRNVFLVFDSDAAENANVREAEARLARVLTKRGARVRVVRLPGGPAGPDGKPTKVGFDDYLLANSADAFRELLRRARKPDKPKRGEGGGETWELASMFVADCAKHKEGRTLYRYREEWHRWDSKRFHAASDEEFKADLTRYLAEDVGVDEDLTQTLVNNVANSVRSLCILPNDIDPPVWLRDGKPQGQSYIAMSNGLLDLDALLAGSSTVMLPHSPRWFSPVCLPYAFDVMAGCPQWLDFLKRNLEADVKRIALAQEWAGYCLTADTAFHRFLFCEGEGGTGKSTYLKTLGAMLGEENVSHVPLERFGERFALTSTLGKLANITAECGEIDRIAEGVLKAFTAGDRMDFDRKFLTPVQAVPTARLVLASNNRPRFNDRSSGLWRRMLLLPWRIEIPEAEQDRRLPDKLRKELSGIFNWAVVGLHRLRREGRFTESSICSEAIDDYRTETNPAREFLSDSCKVESGRVYTKPLYTHYREWAEQNGYRPLGERAFGKEVRRVFPAAVREREGKGERRWYYSGITSHVPCVP